MKFKMYKNEFLQQKRFSEQQIRKKRMQRLSEKLTWMEMVYSND
jgi:hypothetical protein